MDASDGTSAYLMSQLKDYSDGWRFFARSAVVAASMLAVTSGCISPRWDWWRPEQATAKAPEPRTIQDRPQVQGRPSRNRSEIITVSDETIEPPSPIEPTMIVARVADEVILAGDVLGPINQALAEQAGDLTEEQLNQYREQLLKQQLPSVIESKMLYVAYLRYLNKQAQGKDVNAALPKIWERVHQKFDEEEMPKYLQKYQLETAAQLDAKLRQYGWSLAKQRRTFGERNLGMAAAFEKIRDIPETTHEEMLKYYDQHSPEYEFPAQVRWEQLMVRFDKFPDRESAYRAIQRMGNEVALGGAPLSGVAKRDSQAFNAKDGGQHDWTNQGSLASDVLDQAIFSMPVNELSRILEDETGYHIVRVLERREAGRTQFTDAQVAIKKKIEEEKRRIAFEKYMTELRRDIPVWTIYDDSEERLGNRSENPRR